MVNWISPLLLITAVSALPSTRRDVNTVLTNLQTIDSQANSLTSSINSWDGSLFGALGIASASNSLDVSQNTHILARISTETKKKKKFTHDP